MSDEERTPAPAEFGDDTGRGGRKRPSRVVIIAVAVCAVLVAAVIAVDSTSHSAKPAPQPLAPDFTLPSLRDPAQQVSLSTYRGQPVVVNFFASWCAPCKQETPLLARFYRTSRDGVVIIGVDADDTASLARQFLVAEGITYPVAFETTEAVANAYGVSEIGIPETFFLNSRHHIVKRIIGDVTSRELTDYTAIIKSSVTKD
jgi:cytochrome c biogenesis protein CcmG, thiol:disulfide interchange protein DsbE